MQHNDLSTEDAKSRRLPGSDVFRYSHVFYLNEFHRDWGVVALNREAYKAFSDTILVRHRAELKVQQHAVREWVRQRDFGSNLPFPESSAWFSQLEYMNYEYLKVACGFELHLKARLLSRDYLIHSVNNADGRYRTLARAQRERPVKTAELFSIDGFRFNGKENYLPGLKPTSVQFSSLTDKDDYIVALGLPAETVAVIRDYRNLRNQIHLPGDVIETPGLNKFQHNPISEFLIDFINSEIVSWSNQIIVDRKFTYPLLRNFTM
ncbi:MAG: hypothetical protein HYX92_22350 [Chloroflexi bacterium]|nr:hypothetical protein [Chloroflexota bacterium]